MNNMTPYRVCPNQLTYSWVTAESFIASLTCKTVDNIQYFACFIFYSKNFLCLGCLSNDFYKCGVIYYTVKCFVFWVNRNLIEVIYMWYWCLKIGLAIIFILKISNDQTFLFCTGLRVGEFIYTVINIKYLNLSRDMTFY